jgi:hypothetical protein
MGVYKEIKGGFWMAMRHCKPPGHDMVIIFAVGGRTGSGLG